jgi:hypothetical protein
MKIIRENDVYMISLENQINMLKLQVRESELVAKSAVTDVSNLSHYRALYTATLVTRTHDLTIQLTNENRGLKERVEAIEATDRLVLHLNHGKLTKVERCSNHTK